MFSFPIPPRHPRRSIGSGGFSLVEIMVGMVIGMLGIIVMMQIFALAEGQKRTTTGGGDAQNNGAIALYGLQRDIRQSGYGISNFGLIGCNVLLRPGLTLTAMAPTTIFPAGMLNPLIPAGDANTDSLLVVYGNTNGSPQGDGITATTVAPHTSYPVQTPTSFTPGDNVVALPQTRPTPCNLTLTQVASVVSPSVNVNTGAAMTNGATLYNLGQSPQIQAYAIRGGNLTVCDFTANDCSLAANTGNSAIWVPIASNIVSMRAEYGHDANTPMDGIVDGFDQVTPATACNWVKTSAVRLVLVARSGQYEKIAVTTVAPAWLGSAGTPVILTADANWQNYRYKVFQTVVPIRNVVWMGVQAGC